MIFKGLTQPKEENVNQIQLYLHFFKIPKGILLYINKNTLELKEFLVEYDRFRAEKLLKDLAELKIKIDKNLVPQRLAEYPENWQCQYCQFKEICAIIGPDEINWNDFKSKIEQKHSS
jgi:CRISPR/Cas system-associated exonuclease Cas4 (RecB family)